MLNLARADLYRAIHGHLLKLSVLLTLGWVFLCSYGQTATVDLREYITGGEVALNYWDNFFNYYPVVIPLVFFCSSYVSNDFKQGTIKHYVEKGISRWKYFFSKMIVGWCAAIFFLILAFVVGLLCNKMFFGITVASYMTVINVLPYIFCQALYHMSVATLAIAITFLIKNSAFSMAINFMLVFFGYLVLHGLEQMLNLNYMLTLFWAFSNINKTRIEMSLQWIPVSIIIFVGYFLLFGGIAGLIFKKKDIA